METTDIIVKDSKDLVEYSNLQEMTEGCNSAIVSFSITDRGEIVSPTKRYATRKMVVFFSNGFCPETVHAHLLNIMTAHNQSLSKGYLYRLKDNKWHASKVLRFCTYLFKTLVGFVVDSETMDMRK